MIYIILLIGLALRLLSLNQSLWLDEATTALVSKMPLSDIFFKFMPADFHPPLYYVLIKEWVSLFGTSEIALRIPSVIFGILTIYVSYLIAKEIKQKWPIVPAMFLATSGLHIYYSQEARMYSMAAFFVALTVYLYLRKKWMLLAITLPILFLTDYLSILVLPAIFIYDIFLSDKKLADFIGKKRFTKMLLSTVPFVLVVFAWLPLFYKQLLSGIAVKSSSSAWWNILGPVTFKNILLIPTKFIIGRISLDNKTLYYVLVTLLLLLFVYLLSKARNKIIWSWFGVSLVLGIILSFFIPTLTYFRYLFILPAFYLLLSENINKTMVAIVLVINITTSITYLVNANYQREDWRKAAKLISNEKIVFPAKSQTEALMYYGKAKNIISKEEITTSDSTIWLSRYVWNIFDSSDLTRKYIEKLGYNKVSETNFNGLVLFKYSKEK